MDSHDKWFFLLAGAFFLVTAKRGGRQLAEGLREPDDPPERIAAHVRWNVLVWRVVGTVLIAYGVWLADGLVGCSPSNQLVVINESDVQLRDVVASGSGFSQNLGTIAPHEERRAAIRCRGESGLTLRFKAGANEVSVGPDGYFEGSGGYVITATISQDLGLKVKSEPSRY